MVCIFFITTPAQQSSLATVSSMPMINPHDVTTFYNELYSLLRHVPKHNVLIFSENMNAYTVKDGNYKLFSHGSPKEDGEHIAMFTRELACMPKYKIPKKKNLWICTYPNNYLMTAILHIYREVD